MYICRYNIYRIYTIYTYEYMYFVWYVYVNNRVSNCIFFKEYSLLSKLIKIISNISLKKSSKSKSS